MKKKFITFVLALFMALSSITFFACGSKSIDIRAEIGTIVSTIQRETSLTYSQNNSQTYCYENIYDKGFTGVSFQHLTYKSGSSYVKEESGEICNAIFALSLHKILAYYPQLSDFTQKQLKGVISAFDKFKQEYNDFSALDERYNEMFGSASNESYNGFYARYKQGAIAYTKATYNLAYELMKAVEKNFLLPDQSEPNFLATQKQLWTIRYKYEITKALGDVQEFFLTSAKGQSLSNQMFVDVKNFLTNLVEYDCMSVYQIMLFSYDEFITLSQVLDSERKITMEALEDFSVYELEVECDNSIYNYLKIKEYGESDYNQLSRYFMQGGILYDFFEIIVNY